MNFQRDMVRAKSQRRKGKSKPAVLCALASLRENGFHWLLKILIEPKMLHMIRCDFGLVHRSSGRYGSRKDAKTQRKTKTGCSLRLGVFARKRISLAVNGLSRNSIIHKLVNPNCYLWITQ